MNPKVDMTYYYGYYRTASPKENMKCSMCNIVYYNFEMLHSFVVYDNVRKFASVLYYICRICIPWLSPDSGQEFVRTFSEVYQNAVSLFEYIKLVAPHGKTVQITCSNNL